MKRIINIPQLIAIAGALSLSLFFNNCAKFEMAEGINGQGMGKQGIAESVETMSLEDLIDSSLLCHDIGRKVPDQFARCMVIHVDPINGFSNSSGLNPFQPLNSVEQAIENLNVFLDNEELSDENVYVILKFYSGKKARVPKSRLLVDSGLLYDTSENPNIELELE